jgi:hypothetical protein
LNHIRKPPSRLAALRIAEQLAARKAAFCMMGETDEVADSGE